MIEVMSGSTTRVLALQPGALPPLGWHARDFPDGDWKPAEDLGECPLAGAREIGAGGSDFLVRQPFSVDDPTPQNVVELEAFVGGRLVEARLNGYLLPHVEPGPDGVTRWRLPAEWVRPGRNLLAWMVMEREAD